MKAYQILAPLLMFGCAHVPRDIYGREPRVDYFFVPACVTSACESTDAIIGQLERKFGDGIVLQRHCVIETAASSNLDEKLCQGMRQSGYSTNFILRARSSKSVPAIYINEMSVEPRKDEICRELNLEEDCLD